MSERKLLMEAYGLAQFGIADYVITVLTDDVITPYQIPFTIRVPINSLVNLPTNVKVASNGTFTFCY
jgi:hypothetical protein